MQCVHTTNSTSIVLALNDIEMQKKRFSAKALFEDLSFVAFLLDVLAFLKLLCAFSDTLASFKIEIYLPSLGICQNMLVATKTLVFKALPNIRVVEKRQWRKNRIFITIAIQKIAPIILPKCSIIFIAVVYCSKTYSKWYIKLCSLNFDFDISKSSISDYTFS